MTEPARTPNARERGAAATREAILDAAKELFAERGYPATTITEIARCAGVGTNTVYVGFGNKPSIVAALIRRASEGPEADRTTSRFRRASGGQQVIEEVARAVRASLEHDHDIVALADDNATADPVIAEARRTAIDDYRSRLRQAVERIHDLGHLQPRLSVQEGVDLLWFYLGLSPWRVLIDLGWSWDRTERFLVTEAEHALLVDGPSGS